MVPDRTAANDLLLSLLSTIAAHGLYHWFRLYATQRKSPTEAELRPALEREIDTFVGTGFTRQEAIDVIGAMSNALTLRSPQEDALDAGLALLGTGG
jgi:hypothetical protein